MREQRLAELVLEGFCPPVELAGIDKKKDIVNLSSASRHRLYICGVVKFTVRVDSFTVRQPFVVL